MADDTAVPEGTRYDCLRMAALSPPERALPVLERVIHARASEELVQGAVSGLVDVDDPGATSALLAALPHLAGANLDFAVRGLVRDEGRALALLAAIVAGRVPDEVRGHPAVRELRGHSSGAVRDEARRVLGE